MEPEPHDDAGTTGAGPDPDDTEKPDPDVEDDGSVLEKQIQRWKDEGGAWHRPA